MINIAAKNPLLKLLFIYNNMLIFLTKRCRPMYDLISCTKLKSLLAEGSDLIDVRSHFEFTSGAIMGARNIPLEQIHYHVEELDKEKPLLLYCRSGQRSAYAKQILEVMGFSNVHNIGSYSEYCNC